jgi:cell shape-determining protein MreC
MIAIGIILALSAIFIGALIAFWKNIVEWIKKAVNKIMEVLKVAVEGVRTFIVKTREGLQNKSKYYNKNKLTKEWEETVYTKKVSESEVPPEILAKVRVGNVDIDIQTTDELRLAISA